MIPTEVGLARQSRTEFNTGRLGLFQDKNLAPAAADLHLAWNAGRIDAGSGLALSAAEPGPRRLARAERRRLSRLIPFFRDHQRGPRNLR